MRLEGACRDCGLRFDAHSLIFGTNQIKVRCPKCQSKRVKLTNDETGTEVINHFNIQPSEEDD